MFLKSLFFYIFVIYAIQAIPTNTTIQKLEKGGSIDYKIVAKPHHLFVGRCKPNDAILHQENVILNNDGKSHVAARIKMQVEANVTITCVKIFDEVPEGRGGYPTFVAGGVGATFIEFNVMTEYGKGFHFFVQILGYPNNTTLS